jgi:hypothetical protein
MTIKNWVKVMLINLGAALLILSPFLPGPPNEVANLFYNGGQILGILGLIVIPVGVVWTIKELKRKRNDDKYQVDIKAILLLTFPLTLLLTSIYISGLVRDFSRDFAINRTDDLIHSIENFKEKKGKYPDFLTDLTPEFIANIPSPLIMGIDNYDYKKQGDTYCISFQQNVLLGFNFEIVTFDPTDNHKAEGELADIYETGKSHWKYYVYD